MLIANVAMRIFLPKRDGRRLTSRVRPQGNLGEKPTVQCEVSHRSRRSIRAAAVASFGIGTLPPAGLLHDLGLQYLGRSSFEARPQEGPKRGRAPQDDGT